MDLKIKPLLLFYRPACKNRGPKICFNSSSASPKTLFCVGPICQSFFKKSFFLPHRSTAARPPRAPRRSAQGVDAARPAPLRPPLRPEDTARPPRVATPSPAFLVCSGVSYSCDAVARLSSLPDALLSNIVLRLPVKNAGHTTALSRRYCPIWYSVPLILVDSHLLPAGDDKIPKHVERDDSTAVAAAAAVSCILAAASRAMQFPELMSSPESSDHPLWDEEEEDDSGVDDILILTCLLEGSRRRKRKKKFRGSLPGRHNVPRDILGGHDCIYRDYFADQCVYSEKHFRRRFRVSRVETTPSTEREAFQHHPRREAQGEKASHKCFEKIATTPTREVVCILISGIKHQVTTLNAMERTRKKANNQLIITLKKATCSSTSHPRRDTYSSPSIELMPNVRRLA
ncbi:hypothetical protein EJB05_28858, partial [Eragrostis curvula]